ncbi:hypothetical protein [Demequina sp. SO4-18]|uniref:hypothetical protein n=1 Tax=Demequina sp. SO4-18 TaxID=3401026 RepID=UPI003B59DB1E
MSTDSLDLDAIDLPALLREASKRAKWYQTGEEPLLVASAEEIERLRREDERLTRERDAVVEAVRTVHKRELPRWPGDDRGACEHCTRGDAYPAVIYPCPTELAVESAARVGGAE